MSLTGIYLDMNEEYSTSRIIQIRELTEKVGGYARSKINDLIKDGLFPTPFRLAPNGRAFGWFKETIDQWLQEMARAAYATHTGIEAGSNGPKK